jgi:putative Mg2+ transporter-C (MgtC) family protein
MLQANPLMDTRGKPPGTFVTLDLMRLPLGILTGVGFIGAGAILRRDTMVLGVTTAATLWFVTVVGLCFGGGQYALGGAATGLGLAALIGLKPVERRYLERSRAVARAILAEGGPDETEIRTQMSQAGCEIMSWAPAFLNTMHRQVVRFEIECTDRSASGSMPPPVRTLAEHPGVIALHWQPVTRR